MSTPDRPKRPYNTTLTPAERKLRAQIATHTAWANCEDRTARTAPARQAFIDKFEREVDPEGKLPIEERARRAESARKAWYAKMAYRSAQSRKRNKARQAADTARLTEPNAGDAA